MQKLEYCSVIVAFFVLTAAGLFLPPLQASGETPGRTDVVTVLTDTINDRESLAGRAMVELAEQLASTAKIRLLPIAGRGGSKNIDDLLGLRGIDMAIVNSDVLAFRRVTRATPKVRGRVTLISHLFDRKIYLLARPEIADFAALAGKRVAAFDTAEGGYATAQTIFGLSNIAVKLVRLDLGGDLADTALKEVDAIVLLDNEIDRLKPRSHINGSFRLLPLPLTAPLKSAYKAATIGAHELPGVERRGVLPTISAAVILATYDWQPRHTRYDDIKAFASAYFPALSALRRAYPRSIWTRSDVAATLPGWSRHALANPKTYLTAKQIAALSVVEQREEPALTRRPQPPDGKHDGGETLRIVAVARPPFSGKSLVNGGLVVELLSRVLAAPTGDGKATPKIDVHWSSTQSGSVNELLQGQRADIGLPWQTAGCDRPGDLNSTTAVLCDSAYYSEPLMRVVLSLFVRADTPISLEDKDSIRGKTLCVPSTQDLSQLNDDVRRLISEQRVVISKRPSAVECLAAVQSHQDDGFVTTDLEGRQLLHQLGVSTMFRMDEHPFATVGLHAIVSKSHPSARELIKRINEGVKRFKRDADYGVIIRRHLTALLQVR